MIPGNLVIHFLYVDFYKFVPQLNFCLRVMYCAVRELLPTCDAWIFWNCSCVFFQMKFLAEEHLGAQIQEPYLNAAQNFRVTVLFLQEAFLVFKTKCFFLSMSTFNGND